MFGIFKSNPTKKLRKEHQQLLEKGMLAQRKGDIRTYSQLSLEAEELWKKIEKLENTPK
ncbi:MAG: Lacal_2735 family protein [Idiomarina sp.]|nr:Lacal_2735 family protein [Idiomarina sp.]